MPFRAVLTDVADDAVLAQIVAPLAQYNEGQAGPSHHRPLVIRLEDEEGQVAGGLWGYTNFGWLYVQLLAAPAAARGQGLGRRLMEQAEAEARARGCVGAWVDTFTFQAPAFYEGLGYQRFAELADYPPGHSRVFYHKRFEAEPA
ncbi:GNAT family N-acetyltransferase [Chromobacterium sphagni]|uniref:GNAT family N-acetyltransferase n=1 Tax=Chromobacterium sphagni TaxID=1903179 RepID=A0ABX3C7X0_9NEIS|nr:GNAT family N-acetyltransferase [Chromobacterium sphagni]OHX16342.1 GNAT family N-acetyltransferase [Chromobacterium sphagni]